MTRYLKALITAVILLLCSSSLVLAQSDRYLHFDGNNDFAEVPNASQYFVGATGISMTGWFCSAGLGYGHGYFGFRGPGNGPGQMYVIELNGGTLECRYISTTGFNEYVAPAGTVQPGVWQHVAWTYTGAQTELYINGQFIGSTPSTGTFNTTTRSFGIGKSIENGFNFVFSGRIDEVSVWSKGLSQDEILDIMANELNGTEANLELYYKMNQGIPGGNNTAITQLISEVDPGPRNANLTNFTLNGPTSNFNISNEDPSFTVSDFCAGASNQATILGTPGGSFSFGTPVMDGATIDPMTGSITGGIEGTTYTVQYTTNGTCPISESHDVTLVNSPVISNLLEQCSLDQATYTVSFEISEGDPVSYAITGNGTLIGNTFISDAIPTGNSYDFIVTDDNACGSDEVEGVVSCTCPATATYSEDVNFCEGELGTITIEFNGEGPWEVEYEIDDIPQATIISDLDSYELVVDQAGTYSFLNVSDANCSNDYLDPLTVEVTIYELPTATMTGGTTLCEGESVDLEVALTGEGPWEFTYTVDGIPEPAVSSATSPYVFSATQAGTYLVIELEDEHCSGIDLGSTEIIVNAVPEASISGDLIFCTGDQASLEILLSGEPDYQLTYSIDGVIQSTLTLDEATSYDLMTDTEGLFELLTITDANCTGSVSGEVQITEQSLPTAIMQNDALTICSNTTEILEIEVTGEADWTIFYSLDGIPQPGITGATNPLELEANSVGTYELLSVEDNLCSNMDVAGQVMIVYYEPISILFSEDVEICVGDIAEVWVEAMGGQGSSYTYEWQSADLISSSGNTASYSPTQTGSVTVNINEACDYNQFFDIPIVVNQLPPISISSEDDKCGSGVRNLINNTPSSFTGGGCLWSIDGTSFTDCGSIEYFFDLGSYDVGLEVTSSEGCFNAVLLEDFVQVNPSSLAQFSYSPNEVTLSESIVSFSNQSDDAKSYLWSFGNEGFSQEFEPQFDFGDRAGIWKVCLTTDNEFGCMDSTCQFLKVNTELILSVPNSFTPDNDGVNDFFFPVLHGADETDYLFSIYDRTGKIVFESTDIHEHWNGSYPNSTDFYSSGAVYNWRLRARARGSIERQIFTGSVLVLR